MYAKKFVPPLLRKPTAAPPDADEPPNKKTRLTNSSSALTISTAHMPQRVAQTLKLSSASNNLLTRKPLLLVRNPVSPPATTDDDEEDTAKDNGTEDKYYTVLWRKKTTKKHKTFDGDGILALTSAGYATLQDTTGKDLGRTMMRTTPAVGDLLSLGGKDVEINAVLSRADYLSGRQFLKAAPPPAAAAEESAASFQPVSAAGFFGSKFKTPLLGSTAVGNSHAKVPTPRHDPNAEGALVMPRPPAGSSGGGGGGGKNIVNVVVDPFVSAHLRPHQREGVQFLYEAVMGFKPFDGQGAILADEMGLGKTLQTIALLWTLMKQNPVFGGGPVVRKALIVCPVTLINNWRKEFAKWLGRERVGVFVADSKANIRDFTHGRVYSVMIVGYERLQKVQSELRSVDIDIVIADEGHRLKTEKNKSAAAIRGLNTKRRVILSGTPLQNDLHEFYIMVDFVNPGLLESYQTFRKEFEGPIVKSRQPGAARRDVEKGRARGEELARITKLFVLRRTAEILSSYLPPKTEYIVFCRPTPKQLKVYTTILSSPHIESCYRSPDTSLLLITLLKKLCNSPGLLAPRPNPNPSHAPPHPTTQALLATVHPKLLESHSSSHSGKFRVLDRLLLTLYKTTTEKVVIISNYTSTLDLLSSLLSTRGLTHTRLDGSTPQSKRQDIIDAFNRTDHRATFALLLSAKSGGAGINLVGASRLVLFDLDWNPATDLQAMARVHRDGQTRPVVIYRLVTTGCVEEKILQRQLAKTGLAASVVDMKSGVGSFTSEELRDLFSLRETECATHELLGCGCEGRGYVAGPGDGGEGEEGEEMEEVEEEEEEVRYPGLMKASEVDVEKIERERLAAMKRVPKGQLGALMEYSHVLASRLVCTKPATPADDEEDGEEEGEEEEEEYDEVSIEDELLTQVVRDGMGKEVSFIFQKTF